VTLRASEPEWLVQLLLRLGGTGTLVEPAELAEQIRDAARSALDQYA
jgi:proteasome accessory factor C